MSIDRRPVRSHPQLTSQLPHSGVPPLAPHPLCLFLRQTLLWSRLGLEITAKEKRKLLKYLVEMGVIVPYENLSRKETHGRIRACFPRVSATEPHLQQADRPVRWRARRERGCWDLELRE